MFIFLFLWTVIQVALRSVSLADIQVQICEVAEVALNQESEAAVLLETGETR